jgi:Ca-activated chloride channel family protein
MKKIFFLVLPFIAFMLAFQTAEEKWVSGIVSDERGQPIPFASVIEEGTKNGTTTKEDGSYRIKLTTSKPRLTFMYLGYLPQTVKVNDRSTIDVKLGLNTKNLEEVVVVGYGNSSPYTASADINRALSGRVAGLQVQNSYNYSTSMAVRSRPDAMSTDKKYKTEYPQPVGNTEDYDAIAENKFLKATDNPLSTFSIDVDAASYSNIRRFLNQGELPPAGAVRIEEMVNYFSYDYAQPTGDAPFAIHTEIAEAPWNRKHKLVMIGMQGKKIPVGNLPASNLVFLIDVSGSMSSPNKLPLVKASLKMLVDQLRENDHVSIVVYAGAAGVVLQPTSGEEKIKIKDAIDKLESGGSTAGGEGIRLAYKLARENFAKEGNNRVILCTDGDFNIGESSDDAMERLIEQERKSGVFLTVLGYGMGNYKDNKMQKLADKGNGNHAYIDGISEARKVLVSEFGGTLFTIAKDVKLQIEFNPAKVQAYRLIGYENRLLAKEDFNDDTKDAGELGSGHTVTALYEVIPVGVKSSFLRDVDKLKYQQEPERLSRTTQTDEIMTVKFRYKAPDGDVSKLIEHPLRDQELKLNATSANFRFAAAVAEFGMLLRNSAFVSEASFDQVIELARKARGNDEEGYRAEFIRLVENAGALAATKKTTQTDLSRNK